MAAIGAVLFSGKAILAKFQYRYGIDALDVMALRMTFSLPLFAFLAVRETLRARSTRPPLSVRDLLTLGRGLEMRFTAAGLGCAAGRISLGRMSQSVSMYRFAPGAHHQPRDGH